jgi:hypothetical protein
LRVAVKWLFGCHEPYTNGPVPTGVAVEDAAWSRVTCATMYPAWVVSPAAKPVAGDFSRKTTVLRSGVVTEAIPATAPLVSDDAASASKLCLTTVDVRSVPSWKVTSGRRVSVHSA